MQSTMDPSDPTTSDIPQIGSLLLQKQCEIIEHAFPDFSIHLRQFWMKPLAPLASVVLDWSSLVNLLLTIKENCTQFPGHAPISSFLSIFYPYILSIFSYQSDWKLDEQKLISSWIQVILLNFEGQEMNFFLNATRLFLSLLLQLHHLPAHPSPDEYPILPSLNHKNILITSALPYVNNVPHLGNLIGSTLSADIYARHCKQQPSMKCIFICGTDEYGTATETKALQENTTPQAICDHYHQLHCQIYNWFNIGFDHFGRTTTKEQTKITQDIYHDINQNNYLVEQIQPQTYCPLNKRFLADRFVEGICPICAYPDARGDQCDGCGNLLNAIDLKEPKCKICSNPPIVLDTKHLYLDLPQLTPKLLDQLSLHPSQLNESESNQTQSNSIELNQTQPNSNESNKPKSKRIRWSPNAKALTKAWLQEGLKLRAITRDLQWGVPVPREGYEDKVFYVWFDAPIGYISITANYTPQWSQWWLSPSHQVELVQFMGKDNTPFHTIIFPSMLLGTHKPWTTLGAISTTEYLTFEGEKFSKSRHIGVFGDQVQHCPSLNSDLWRFYLTSIRPEKGDADFTWMDLRYKINDLADTVGNLVQRTLKFVFLHYDAKIPHDPFYLDEEDRSMIIKMNDWIVKYREAFQEMELKEALRITMQMAHLGNEYFQASKPWHLVKTRSTPGTNESERNEMKCCAVIYWSCALLMTLAKHLFPFMPQSSIRILHWMGSITAQEIKNLESKTYHMTELYNTKLSIPYGFHHGVVKAGTKIIEPLPLFPKITPMQLETLKRYFSGENAEKIEEISWPVDMRVAKITSAKIHPEKKHCYILDLIIQEGSESSPQGGENGEKNQSKSLISGEVKTRTAISALVEHVSVEALIGKNIVAVCNIKPCLFKGVLSNATVLTIAKSSKLAVIEASHAPIGTSVFPAKGIIKQEIKPIDIKAIRSLNIKYTPHGLLYKECPLLAKEIAPIVVTEGDWKGGIIS